MTTPMPKTWNKIKAEYAGTKNKALRETIFRVARNGGSVLSLLRTIAFSNPQLDRRKLEAIAAVAQAERSA